MTELSHIDILRLDVVELRATLRALRQDLVRRKRAVGRATTPSGGTAGERAQRLDWDIHDDAEVIRLEDEILRVQHAEDLKVARLENEHRAAQAEQWLIRERMADSNSELATCIAQTPLGHLVLMLTNGYGDKSAYTGQSAYMLDREVE